MKLGIWIDGSMEIMHVILFSFLDQNSGCYGNGNSQNRASTDGSFDNSKSIPVRLMKLRLWIDGNMEIMHVTLFFSSGILWFTDFGRSYGHFSALSVFIQCIFKNYMLNWLEIVWLVTGYQVVISWCHSFSTWINVRIYLGYSRLIFDGAWQLFDFSEILVSLQCLLLSCISLIFYLYNGTHRSQKRSSLS